MPRGYRNDCCWTQRLPTATSTVLAACFCVLYFLPPRLLASGYSLFSAGQPNWSHRPSCNGSDDPAYTCFLPRPPGAFEDEFRLYLSEEDGQLSVKIVVPRIARSRSGTEGGSWAALGLSPNGKMAGPSEAIIGVLRGDHPEGSSVRRYVMNGYSASSVVPLGEGEQLLSGERVEAAAQGSLIVRFKRPFKAPTIEDRDADAVCLSLGSNQEEEAETPATDLSNGSCDGDLGPGRSSSALASPPGLEGARGNFHDDVGATLDWMDPRGDDVLLIWGYGSRAWPSYHEATGSFRLPSVFNDTMPMK